MSKRIVSLMLVSMVLLLSFASACTPTTPETVIVTKEVIKEVMVTPPPAEPVEKGLVEFGGFHPADSPWGKQYRLLGYRLEQENPECEFLFSEYPGPEGAQAMVLRAKEGDPVSITESGGIVSGGNPNAIRKNWEEGLIFDLSEAMQEPAYGQTEGKWIDTFNAAAQEHMVTEGGKIGAIPLQQTQIILWYNKALYEQYSLEFPKTWGQLLDNCEVLKENGIACIGGGGFNGYIGYWYDMIIYRLMGKEKMTALYTHSDPNVTWEDPMVLKAAEMLLDLIDKGYTSDGFIGGDFTANQIAFFTGKSAHLFVGTWLIGEMKDAIPEDFQTGVGYFPAIEGYEDLTPYESAFGFLNVSTIYNPGKNEKTPHSVDCAIKYMKLLSSPEVQKEISSGSNQDYVTTIIDGQGPSGIPGIGELLGQMKEWIPFMAGAPSIAAETSSKYWDNVANLAAGGLSPQEFSARMLADWEDIYSRIE
ncbi:MAG: ABC transporter substrate-binding protein [Anaerolineaceae bacterium]|jgi:raffinose/stachyose/melibiose transport system substrate-binding protein